MSILKGRRKEDFNKLREDANQFLNELEKCLNNFEEDRDPTRLKNKIKKSIIHFKLGFYD